MTLLFPMAVSSYHLRWVIMVPCEDGEGGIGIVSPLIIVIRPAKESHICAPAKASLFICATYRISL